jgi:transcriptional regulator with XRE-family HTH domain
MATRERAVDRGTRRGRQLILSIGRELREARQDRGLSAREVAAAIGVSASHVSRLERGLVDGVGVLVLARACAVLGLEMSLRAFPVGEPIRDGSQVGAMQDLQRIVHPSLRWNLEVPMPNPQDLRAWDATVAGAGWIYGVDLETAPRDAQAVARRMQLKARDSGVDGMILVLKDSRQSRLFLDGSLPYLSTLFPTPGHEALEALRRGERPAGNAIVLLRRAHRPRR